MGRQSVGGAQNEWPLDRNLSLDGLYSDGLTLNHISSISYALAFDLNCPDADDSKQKSVLTAI